MQAAQAAAQQEEQAQGEQGAKPTSASEAQPAAAPAAATPAPAPFAAKSPVPASTKAPETRPSSASLSASSSGSGKLAGVKASDIAAHRLVQRVLQVTADAGEAGSSSGLVLVDYSGSSQSQEGPVLFNVDAVSELVCARLLSGASSMLPQQQGVLYLGKQP